MNPKRILAAAFAAALLFSLAMPRFAVAAVSKADAAYIQSVAETKSGAGGLAEKKGKKGWWARTWTTTDGSGFFGRPEVKTTTENSDTTIVIRYTRYSTEYDLGFHSPVWGAYTIDGTALKNDEDGDRPASNPDFARPGQFFQEPLVVAASKELDISPASHSTFTSTYDPRFPFVRAGGSVTERQAKESKTDRSIQRGHMVPNNAMKCQGTEEQGQTAQIESFSVANIVPQMAKSNAPTWSGLESACFDWANEIGQVWCIVGPVYNDRAHPTFVKKLSNGAEQVDAFYERLYFRQWNASAVAAMLSSVPSIMMWDDHDIFDGWGSHPAKLQACAVYQRIYRSAERAFRMFQLRGNAARGYLEAGGSHFGYVAALNGETFLMLDHRTGRTPTVVMGEGQWRAFKSWLSAFNGKRLFIQSAVPVVYRTFGFVERALAATEKREELEDDLNDHWSAREHQQERLRFIYTFIERMKVLRGTNDPKSYHPRWVFLSGDVHVACMGSVWERDLDLGLYQVVSSALVHPPPSLLQWLGICAFSSDGNQKLANGDLETEIHEIAGAGSKFLRTRNYARLELEEEKVWINWRCESDTGDTVFCA